MADALKLFAAGVLTAILCASVRTYQNGIAIGLAIVASAVLTALILRMFEPVVQYLDLLRGSAGVEPAVFAPLLRIFGIGILTEFACALCREAGEQTIGRVLELGGCVAAVDAAMPLLDGVLDLIRPYLGG